jgi:hypothetical protein
MGLWTPLMRRPETLHAPFGAASAQMQSETLGRPVSGPGAAGPSGLAFALPEQLHLLHPGQTGLMHMAAAQLGGHAELDFSHAGPGPPAVPEPPPGFDFAALHPPAPTKSQNRKKGPSAVGRAAHASAPAPAPAPPEPDAGGDGGEHFFSPLEVGLPEGESRYDQY